MTPSSVPTKVTQTREGHFKGGVVKDSLTLSVATALFSCRCVSRTTTDLTEITASSTFFWTLTHSIDARSVTGALDLTRQTGEAGIAHAHRVSTLFVHLHHSVDALVLTERSEETLVTRAEGSHPADDVISVAVNGREVVRGASALSVAVLEAVHVFTSVTTPVVLAVASERPVLARPTNTSPTAVHPKVAKATWLGAELATERTSTAVARACVCFLVDVARSLVTTVDVTLGPTVAVCTLTRPIVAVV